ncbi:protein SREK1IP1-like [Dendronephthya gigantea]|uniref:protein SREK1IP1-like n=1 Tax=Dendronephthya gigantea TaxID=151771 RepID=UPI00106AAA96|nr:protein SREK1IP1-like [Dendronephthya gigantea]XP_028414804.1 protein SREK1IP1-like [Dendronephthya gigantea]
MVFYDEDQFNCPNCNELDASKCSGNGSDKGDDSGDDYPKKNCGLDQSKDKSESDESKDESKSDQSKDESKSDQFNQSEEKTSVIPKRKKKSNVEKSLEFVFKNFKESAADDFDRYQKLEEERIKKEHEFRMQEMQLENERRKEEREHELCMMRMLLSAQQPGNGTTANRCSPFSMPIVYGQQPCFEDTHPTGDFSTYYKL